MAARRKATRAASGERTLEQWERGLSPMERRVEDVAALMLKGAWISGVSDRKLAEQWNVEPNTVRRVAAEASRLIRSRLRDDPRAKEEARAQIIQLFDVIRARCMAKGDAVSMRVALDALRAYGFYLGIEPAKRLDVHRTEDPFAGWTTEEKLAYVRDGRRPRRALGRFAPDVEASSEPSSPGNGGDAEPVH